MYILISNCADILYFHGNDEVTIWRESTEGSTSFSAGRRTKDWLCPPPGREVSREEGDDNDERTSSAR
jgi:hypothetical protein